jgi:hypothetical protein
MFDASTSSDFPEIWFFVLAAYLMQHHHPHRSERFV